MPRPMHRSVRAHEPNNDPANSRGLRLDSDRLILIVFGPEHDSLPVTFEPLEGRLPVESRHHDLTVISDLLLPNYHVVALVYSSTDHAVPVHPEGKVGTASRPLCRNWNASLDILFGQDRTASHHATDEWNPGDRQTVKPQPDAAVPWA